MDNGLIVDLIFALVLVLGVVLGAKRGLFRSFMALAAVLVALIGASLLTDALTGPVTEALMPRAEKSVQEWLMSMTKSPGLMKASSSGMLSWSPCWSSMTRSVAPSC